MTRRLIALVALCLFAALTLTPSAEAQSKSADRQEYAKVARLGCNAPNLVPVGKEPRQWRLLAPAFCIHRTTQVVLSPWDIVVAHQKGFWWCFAWSQKPASPQGVILGWFTATRFCSSRAWYYVRVIT